MLILHSRRSRNLVVLHSLKHSRCNCNFAYNALNHFLSNRTRSKQNGRVARKRNDRAFNSKLTISAVDYGVNFPHHIVYNIFCPCRRRKPRGICARCRNGTTRRFYEPVCRFVARHTNGNGVKSSADRFTYQV